MVSNYIFTILSLSLLAFSASASPTSTATGTDTSATTIRLADVKAALATVSIPDPEPTASPLPGPQSNQTLLLSQPQVQESVDKGLALLAGLLGNDTVSAGKASRRLLARTCPVLNCFECEIGGCISPAPSGIQATPAAVAFVAKFICGFWFPGAPGAVHFVKEGTFQISPNLAHIVLEYHVRDGCNTCSPRVPSYFSITELQCEAAFAKLVQFANAPPPANSCAGDMQGVSGQGCCEPIWFHWYTS